MNVPGGRSPMRTFYVNNKEVSLAPVQVSNSGKKRRLDEPFPTVQIRVNE